MDWADPDVIVHCAAITNVDYCEQHPDQAMAVNAESVRKLMEISAKARQIFISTDAVFPDGVHLASESDQTAPETIYGKSKQLGERYIQQAGESHVAIRTTIVGKNVNTRHRGFAEWVVDAASNGRRIALFSDAVFTPITTWHLGDELEWIMQNTAASGILHVAGKEPISKYDFGMKMCEKLGLSCASIAEGSIDECDFLAARSRDQTLDSGYYEQLSGRGLPSTLDTINSLSRHF